MKKYGFVYIWYDKKHKRYYVGCRWGREDDGYICSSPWMKRSYNNRPEDFKRRILSRVYSNKKDLLKEEYRWLSMIKSGELKTRYYNLHNHHFGHWTDDEDSKLTVSQKISKSHNRPETKKRLIESKIGDNNPMKRPEVIAKRLDSYKKKDHIPWNKGLKTGPNPEHSKKMKGRKSPNKGKKLSINDRNNLKYCKKWVVIEPSGNEILVHNLNSWCEDKNLSATNLRSVAYGKRNSHKGYKCRKVNKI